MRKFIAPTLAVLVMVGLLKLSLLWHGPDPNVGLVVAPFELKDPGGRLLRLPPPGKEVLINYWAAWCQPCLQEMPALQAFAAQNAVNGTQLVGIALDSEVNTRAFLKSNRIEFPVLLEFPGPKDSSVALGNNRGLLPYSVLVGADGRIRATRIGPFADKADLEAWVADAR